MEEIQKQKYLKEHLPYALKMLRYTFGEMLRLQHYLSWNAHYESFAGHARELKVFLTNGDKKNVRASDFASGYRARIGSVAPLMTKLNEQVFHLDEERPAGKTGAKFNTANAQSVIDWIEDNFTEFLAALPDHYRKLFNDKLADPQQDMGYYTAAGPTGPGAPASGGPGMNAGPTGPGWPFVSTDPTLRVPMAVPAVQSACTVYQVAPANQTSVEPKPIIVDDRKDTTPGQAANRE